MGNMQGEMETVVQLENCDLVATIETWRDKFHNWNTTIEGYKLSKRDRPSKRGGEELPSVL